MEKDKPLVGVPLTEGLLFDEEEHRYTFEGERFASVSEVIRHFGFGKSNFSDIPEWALKLGTLRHLFTQLEDEGDLDESTVHERLIPDLNAWRQWKEDNPEAKFVAIECPVADRFHKIAGTIDRVISCDGQYWVLDIKGSTQSPSYQLQVSAYAWMVEEAMGIEVSRLLSVHLLNSGKYREKEYERATNEWVTLAQTYQMLREGRFGATPPDNPFDK